MKLRVSFTLLFAILLIIFLTSCPNGTTQSSNMIDGIPIIRGPGVTVVQFQIVVQSIKDQWNDTYIDSDYRTILKNNLREIQIIQTAVDQTRYYDYEIIGGKVTIKIQHNSPYGPLDALVDLVDQIPLS